MFFSQVLQGKLTDAAAAVQAALDEVVQSVVLVSPAGCESLLHIAVEAAAALFEADEEYEAARFSMRHQREPVFNESTEYLNDKANAKRKAKEKMDKALSACTAAGVSNRAMAALGDAVRAANECRLALRRLGQPHRVV